MSKQDTNIAATTEAIEAAFGGRWGAWLSDTGQWWATRTHTLTAREISAGRIPHVRADSPEELIEYIREQESL
jgi:hypothetical protein